MEKREPIIVTDKTRGQFFGQSYVARKMGIGRMTLYRLFKRGDLPAPLYQDKNGRPLISFKQLELLVLSLRSWRLKKKRTRDRREKRAGWRKLWVELTEKWNEN